jgi:hypothetical protein
MMIQSRLDTRTMTMIWLRNAGAIVLCLLLFVVASVAAEKGDVVSEHATGTFEVKIAPETVAGQTPDPSLGQMSIDKVIHGDLEGTSKGSMLTAGYVAMEKVTGTLKGRTGSFTGSFALMHHATMSGGQRMLDVDVVPGSGTDALKGLAGKMTIRIEAGQHYYDFDYTLPKGE